MNLSSDLFQENRQNPKIAAFEFFLRLQGNKKLSVLFVWKNNITSYNVRKHTFRQVRPVKIQISLCISAVSSESSLSTFWIVKFLHVDNKDWSDCN